MSIMIFKLLKKKDGLKMIYYHDLINRDYNINDLSWLDDMIISKIELPLHHNIERMINYCLRKILKDNDENSKLIFNFYLPFTENFVQDYQSEAHHDCSCINFDIVETIFRDNEKYLYKKMKKQNIPYKRIEFDKFIKYSPSFKQKNIWSAQDFFKRTAHYMTTINEFCEEFHINIPDMSSEAYEKTCRMMLYWLKMPEKIDPLSEIFISLYTPEYMLLLLLITYTIKTSIFLQFSFIRSYLNDLNDKRDYSSKIEKIICHSLY